MGIAVATSGCWDIKWVNTRKVIRGGWHTEAVNEF